MNCQEALSAMSGFLDGELGPSARVTFQLHLTTCPVCSKALLEQQAIKAALPAEELRFKATEGLRSRVLSSLKLQAAAGAIRFGWWRWPVLGGCVLLGIGLVLLWQFVFTRPPRELAAREVTAAHIQSLRAESMVEVSSSVVQEVKIWFQGKLNFSPPMPDLDQQGFALVGGRLEHLDGRPVAALVYRRGEHFINLFVWQSQGAKCETGSGGIHQESRQGYQIVHWSRAGVTYWAVADLAADELFDFASQAALRRGKKDKVTCSGAGPMGPACTIP
jgi:anti-sigma factor RsiW